jgi:Spy/CpxP family protein refolding chaperone
MLRKSLVGSLLCLFLAAPLALRATDEKSADTKKSKAAAADANSADDSKAKGRLPNNWGKLGLTSTQRDKIYSIENSYAAQIEELQKKINDLQSKRDAEMHGVLTADQQKQLATVTSDSTKTKSAKKAAAADAKNEAKGSANNSKNDSTTAKSASASK